MATQPMGEANQQLWDETLTQLLTLSDATVRRNTELENRVTDLEVELAVWKQAHSVALENSEREINAHNVQVAALNRQISHLDSFNSNQNPLILCAINGNEFIFNGDLLVQGYPGGKSAAQQLTKAIAEYLSTRGQTNYSRISFWITIYYNKLDILEALVANNICSQDQFEAFSAGFSSSSTRFSIIDVGYSKDAVLLKMREYLQTYIYFPQTLRIFFGGCDLSFLSIVPPLERDHLSNKLVMLTTMQDTAVELAIYPVFHLNVDGVFLAEKIVRSTRKLSPIGIVSYSAVTSNGGLISPQSPARGNARIIDPSLPLHKQNPPPCNEHYLMTCSKGAAACKYSHDYVLTVEQLVSLASNAKKAPCNWLKNGVPCPYGDKCCWGHVCPNGPKCFHLSKGKCWFKGDAMHPPSPVTDSES